MLLLKQLKIDDLRTVSFKEFVRSLNDVYEPPSAEYFKSEIVPNLNKFLEKEACNEKFLRVINVFSQVLEGELYLFAVLSTKKGKYISLLDVSIPFNQTYEDNDERQKSLFIHFCDSAVEKATAMYKVKIFAVIYECDIHLTDAEKISQNKRYFRVQSISFLLREIEAASLMVEEGDSLDRLKKLSNDLRLADLSISNATEVLMQAIIDRELFSEVVSPDLIVRFINPLYMASNFFNPQYKGLTAKREELKDFDLLRKAFTFNMFVLSDAVLCEQLKQFTTQSEYFGPLFDLHSSQPERFWRIALKYYKELAEIVLELLNLPAISRQIDLNRILSSDTEVSTELGEIDTRYKQNLLLN